MLCLRHFRISFSLVSCTSSNELGGSVLGIKNGHFLSRIGPSFPLAADSRFTGWSEFCPAKKEFLVRSRTLAGRAHVRAAAVTARVSEAFSLGETTSVEEGSLQEVGSTTSGEIDVNKLEGNMRKLSGSNIVMDVNMGRRHLIKEVEFIKSSPKESECPKDGLPEFALVGRSNVGKSSLINALVNRKEIAQTSKRPGKTQLINHFRVNKKWYLVDLPGYGYAKAPVAVKTEWNDFTKSYFLNRKTLVSVLLLVDASIPPLQIDLDCADWLGRNKIPVTVVFTKCDRRKKRKNGGKPPDENVAEFEKQLQESYSQTPPWVMTSSTTGQGKDELLMHMARLLDYWDN
ncbi:unnamed protein product [Calypogeia fissa]